MERKIERDREREKKKRNYPIWDREEVGNKI
jgi:hypothetical protein